MLTGLSLEQLGALSGGVVVGVAGAGAGIVWLVGRTTLKGDSHAQDADALEGIRTQISEAIEMARDAKASAQAVQGSMDTIGRVIESSMKALGDRLEGALRDVKVEQARQGEEVADQGSRLTALETEVDLTAGRPPRLA